MLTVVYITVILTIEHKFSFHECAKSIRVEMKRYIVNESSTVFDEEI